MHDAPAGYALRLAREGDLEAIPRIEIAAAALFAPWGLDRLFASATTPIDVLDGARRRGDLIVATEGDRAIGFAMISRVDGHANLDELGVLPAHGRRGVGGALVSAAMDRARSEGLSRMTLCAMREVPFNAPWYARLGFRELPREALGPGMRALFASELAAGLASRVFMAIAL